MFCIFSSLAHGALHVYHRGMIRYIPKAKRVYDPKDPYRFCYERCTPESEAEVYRIFGNGPVAFTRPGGPPPPAKPEAGEQKPPPVGKRPSSRRRTIPQDRP